MAVKYTNMLPLVLTVLTDSKYKIERSSVPDCGVWRTNQFWNKNLFTDGFFSLGTKGGRRKLSTKNIKYFQVQRWEPASLQGPPEGGAGPAGGGEAEGGGGGRWAPPPVVGGAGQGRGLEGRGGQPGLQPGQPGQWGQGGVLSPGGQSDWRF